MDIRGGFGVIYFDNAASTPLSEAVREEIQRDLDLFANPSSLHGAGFAAEMLFGANAALVRKYFGKEIGRLREGATADIAVMDFRPFGNPDAAKLDEQMITMMSGADCRLTIVDGMIVMRDGKIIRTNESGVRERAEKSIVNIWKILHHIEEEPDDWECED